jgi:hypothetical protein
MRAQAIGMVDPARWRSHLWLRDAGFSDSPSIALSAQFRRRDIVVDEDYEATRSCVRYRSTSCRNRCD